jgi:xylan 1,4-beta-xylosidase
MLRITTLLSCLCILATLGFGQARSSSFFTYLNPVIPGDHPDCTLTKVGKDYYTTGSSFNPTPVIYHSTDLVHWEAIAQPVSAAWSGYGDSPGGGCWGGDVVYYMGLWWDFFSRGNTMYFVTASDVKGPWSLPTKVNNPSQLSYGLGYDNSIFIDDNGKWYLVVKNGQPNNGIVELGSDGQPTGTVYNLNWLNPSPSYPYSWAEGPVMWKYRGYYYYSFARDLSGGQKVMRSTTLTADSASWKMLGDFFNLLDPLVGGSLFTSPNHSSNVVTLDDSTFWVMHPLYAKGEWKGQGRQGLLNQVHYDVNGKPTADYPVNKYFWATSLPSGGIPWMVPHSDFFTATTMSPEWSFLGYTPDNSHSLTTRPGWLTLSLKGTGLNTVIKNDGEHNYSLITRLDFGAKGTNEEAGLWIMRGDQQSSVKLYSSIDTAGRKTIFFAFDNSKYQVENALGDTVWFKLIRIGHTVSGYFGVDGFNWTQVGQSFNISTIDSYSDFSTFTGTRQGLYVLNSTAYFDCYIYRDAYTPIAADCPANQYGATASAGTSGTGTLETHVGDWALYAGVEFGRPDYPKQPDSLYITASCAATGGDVEVWLDSLDTGTKIAQCAIASTGSWSTFKTFGTIVLRPIAANHDVYLKFKGTSTDSLFVLRSLVFTATAGPASSVRGMGNDHVPDRFELNQNYPNPFNPSTRIKYSLPDRGFVSLKVYDVLGRKVATLIDGIQSAGQYTTTFGGAHFASGIYFCRLREGTREATKKLVLLR